METLTHLSTAELEAGLNIIRQSPSDQGLLKLIVRRPKVDERELVNEAELDLEVGLIGEYPRADHVDEHARDHFAGLGKA